MLAVPKINLSSTRMVCVTESGSAGPSAPLQMAALQPNHKAPAATNTAVAGTGARDQRRNRRQAGTPPCRRTNASTTQKKSSAPLGNLNAVQASKVQPQTR